MDSRSHQITPLPFTCSSQVYELKTDSEKKERKVEERDLFSELSEDVVLHIMHFMKTETAVRISILSKGWRNLWKSLTSLTIAHPRRCFLKLPHSLELPMLKTLNLSRVAFTARDGDECVEPFSSCSLLNSLALDDCVLSNSKLLSISNPNLSRLTMKGTLEDHYKIVLSTPNLTHLGIISLVSCHFISSTCDLPLLEEAYIGTGIYGFAYHQMVLSLLQIMSYAKILTLNYYVLQVIVKHDDFQTPPLRFVRLQTLKVENIPQAQVLMKYLPRNSQSTQVQVLQIKPFSFDIHKIFT